MALPPKLIGSVISSITGLITSTSMSFVGLALNYGFQPDFVMRQAGLPAPKVSSTHKTKAPA